MAGILPRDHLNLAALAVHRILKEKGFDHAFLGGYELQIIGSERGTKDVDVVVKRPLFNGFEKIKQAFADNSEFSVFDGNRTDAIRAIHMPSSVGIDIMLENLPKKIVKLPGDELTLPFFTTTQMFIRKVKCLAERNKESDRHDLVYLFERCSLDVNKINKKVLVAWRDEALVIHRGHTRVEEILRSLDVK